VCEGCGAYYGGLASHTHHYDKKIPTNTYKVTDATCEEKATYYYACSCGKAGEETYENGDYAVCVDVDKNHVCDVCKQPVGQHVAGDSTHVCVYCGENVSDCADDNNDHHCDVCGEKLSEHTGGTATSTQKAVCAICGEEYGDLLHGVIVDETIPTSKIYRLGDYMYDFTITDCNGNSYTLSNVLETKKMVVLNFWASWCGPCQSEFPVMEQAYNTYKNEVEIFAISVDSYDTQEAVRGMGLDMPAFDGTNGRDVSSHFNISAIPVTVVIDRYGIVSYMHTGAMVTLSDWTTLFDMYIADDYTPANFVE